MKKSGRGGKEEGGGKKKEEGRPMKESELMRLFTMVVLAMEETHA